ncbi:MAG: MBL fold metallo-hydrolase [Beijerinckiaceae bacterium]|nr:MBL fold metallo-hydrolase [Beijerinckiaceae bacterium]
MSLSVEILGCGSSGGVPRVAQGWGACDPTNPKNRRRRCSILVRQASSGGETTVLVDTSPDLRDQLLTAGVKRLDGVIFTHEHADHTHGIDDLRPVVIQNRRLIDVYLDEATAGTLHTRFRYIFETPPGSEYPPLAKEHRIRAGETFSIAGQGGAVACTPFNLHHGSIDALGLRFGGIAYTPDVNAIPDESVPYLEGLDCWIIDALRLTPHPSHFRLAESLAWIERMKPKRAVLTNLHTDLDYDALARQVPAGVVPAYDGMVVEA